jgi:hypothetical protein
LALVPKAAEKVDGALGALGLKDTAEDRKRKARASQLEAAALNGDRTAVAALEFDAFDPRGASPADTRTPRDGKYSPAAVRDLAVKALKRVAAAGVPLTSQQRYAQLKVPLPTTATQDIVRAVAGPIAEKLAPDVGTAVADAARPSINKAVIIGVVAVVLVAVLVLRGARG